MTRSAAWVRTSCMTVFLCSTTVPSTSAFGIQPPLVHPKQASRTRESFRTTTTTIATTTTELREHLPMDPWDVLDDVEPENVRQVNLSKHTDEDDSKQAPRIESQYQSASPPTSHFYPFASMMQGTASYIANHLGKTVVVHIPGELVKDTTKSDNLLQDIGLCWLLGMKIVLVVSGGGDECPLNGDTHCIRQLEEHVGFLRIELERKLNRCLRTHAGTSSDDNDHTKACEGNVVSGNNFAIAQRFEADRLDGLCNQVHANKIEQILQRSDVVLLSTVLLSASGDDWVHVEGPQLAAQVATALTASKLILMQTESTMLTHDNQYLQEVPLELARQIVSSNEDDTLSSELYRNLEWGCYAVASGVSRAHLVNPNDGALLEELFTSQNGLNTCVYHDDEQQLQQQQGIVNGMDDLPADLFETMLQKNSTFYFG